MAMHGAPQNQWTHDTFPKELFYCIRPLLCDGIQLTVPSWGNWLHKVFSEVEGAASREVADARVSLLLKEQNSHGSLYWLASVMLPSVINIVWSFHLLQKVEVDHSPEVTEQSFDELSADPSG